MRVCDMSKILTVILYLLLLNPLLAGDFKLESGIKRNTVIELYTSEGCSSCPPAEKFLNSLQTNNDLWKKWIPVAFHVDYWDYIGWKDRYARKEFGQRQSLYASLTRATTVYTPAFMVNGSSWRRGLFSSSLPESDSQAGKLTVLLRGKQIRADYKPLNKNKFPLRLNVAVLGMDLTTHISRGENEGRIAQHDFVVVGFDSMVSGNLSWNLMLPELHYTAAKKYALAVWVSEINNPTPLQAVGGEMPDYKL